MSWLENALTYAGFGWSVLPVHNPNSDGLCSCGNAWCKNVGKHPRVSTGVHAATRDRRKLSRWAEKWPKANIGISTGKISNLVVLDEDPRHGSEESLDDLDADTESFQQLLSPIPVEVAAIDYSGIPASTSAMTEQANF